MTDLVPWSTVRCVIDAHDSLIEQVAARSKASPAVIGALRETPRHRFMADMHRDEACVDAPYPIGFGQTISQPTVVAMMLNALALTPSCRVLEIGTGSGYEACALSKLAAEVFTVERVPELADLAQARLRELGCTNVRVRVGDGSLGWPEAAPFDRVISSAAPTEIVQPWIDQLKPGGHLVLPVGPRSAQDLVKITKRDDGTTFQESLGSVSFVPLVCGPRG